MAEVVAETARVRLRDWMDEDEAAFYRVMNTPEVMRHLGGVQTPEEWKAAFDRISGFTREFGHTFWIVENRRHPGLLRSQAGQFTRCGRADRDARNRLALA